MVDRNNIADVYSLSPLQEGILFHHITDETSNTYFVQAVITVKGEIDVDLFEKTFNKIIERYDILRTVYTYKKTKKPRQVVLKKAEIEFCFKDISDLDEEAKIEFSHRFKEQDKQKGFDLGKEIPMRISVLKVSGSVYRIVWGFHHIAMDGWCLGILFGDLMRLYVGYRKGEDLRLEPVPPYKHYIRWLEQQDKEKGLRFWKEYLAGYEQPAVLPGGRKGDIFQLKDYRFVIDNGLTGDLDKIAVGSRVTINTVMQTLWGILLQRYNNTDDVVYGAVVSNRPPEIADVERMVGLFINTVPVRIRSDGRLAFSQLVRQVQQHAALAKPYEYVPLPEIQANSALNRQLIHLLMAFENYPVEKSVKEVCPAAETGFRIEEVEFHDRTHYDFTLIVGPGKSMTVRFSFNEAVYDLDFIKRLESHFKHLLVQAAANPGIAVNKMDILTGEEREQLLNQFNDTQSEYPAHKTIHELFAEQVRQTPDRTALHGAHQTHRIHRTYITYSQLSKKSNHLAKLLIKKGIQPGDIVGIMVERSLEMVMGILGILKAGGAYLPIDPDFPEDRITYMLRDSGIEVLLTNLPEGHLLFNCQLSIVNCQLLMSPLEVTLHHSSFIIHHSGCLAYVVYTSGSTGRPKGVMVEHRNVVRLVKNTNYIRFRPGDRVLQTGPLEFDASTFEIWGPLLNGLTLCLVSKDDILNPGKLKEAVRKYDIRILWLTSPLFNQLCQLDVEIFAGVRNLLVGGDVLNPVLINQVRRRFPGLNIINGYGPTENTTFSTTFPIQKEYPENIPIGKPIANSTAYILDKHHRLQPVGLVGELWVGGDGVARGYLNNPELTNSKFQAPAGHPLSFSASQLLSFFLYRTGDLARWLPDGNIQFLGRMDHQVKIRGFRIELAEIENHLLRHPRVKEALVTARSDENGSKYLSAYIVPSSTSLGVPALRDHLAASLPGYMVPAYFTILPEMPLTLNGKVDRKALPEPETGISTETYAAPRTGKEILLAEIWQEVLGINRVGGTDNFFEIGGDSIKAIQVSARLKKHQMELKITDLFLYPTIRELGKYIREKGAETGNFQGIVEGEVELTPVQRWFFENNSGDRHHFNQALMLYKEEGFNETFIEKIFAKLLQHHDALRMVYDFSREGGVVQRNRGVEGKLFGFEIFHFDNKENVEEEIERQADRLQAGMDLANGPLVKTGLFKTSAGDHLLIIIYHLVVDGISWRILLEDVGTAYRQLEQGEEIVFPDKTASFKAWARKLFEYAAAGQPAKESAYWKEIENTPVEPLPKDHTIGLAEKKSKYMQTISVKLSEPETETLLRKVNRAYNTEINDILLTALGLAVKDWAGIEKILINLEGHGREPVFEGIDITRTVGWFTTRYPVYLDLSRTNDLSHTVKWIKETLRRIPNKGFGYGLLNALTPGGKREPEISFNYLGQLTQDRDSSTAGIRLSDISPGKSTGPEIQQPHALNINGLIVNGKLDLSFSYNRLEYDKTGIRALADHFKSNLLNIIQHCARKNKTELTPHDVGYQKMSIEALQGINHYINGISEDLEIQYIYPLSPMQGGMLYHSLSGETPGAYFVQSTFTLEGEIEKNLLETAFNKLLERYDIFRTLFIYEALEEPVQVVLKNRKAQVYYEDISHLSKEQQALYIEEFKKKDRHRGFHLDRDILIRVSLFKAAVGTYYLVWSFHHILMDGWCLGIVYKELLQIYQWLRQGETVKLPPAPPYRTYIRWLDNQDREAGYRFWQQYLEDYEQPASLPETGRWEKEKQEQYQPAEYEFIIDEARTSRLNEVAGKNGVTVNTVFQALWGILLQWYNNTEDVVFGAVVSGRPSEIEGIETMVGLFINTVPVRITGRGSQAFSQLLTAVRERVAASKAYEHLSLAQIQSNSLLKERLINHLMVFENYPVQTEIQGAAPDREIGFKAVGVDIREQTNYDFDITIIPGKQFVVKLSYNAFTYESTFITNTGLHFENMVRQVLENPYIRIDSIEIITEEEKHRILYQFNNTHETPYPTHKTLNQLFEEQVNQTPDHIAVIGTNPPASVTYKQLNRVANRLARLLREKGVIPDSIVGLIGGHSLEMMIGILGIWKAGGAYLPIDPDYPEERIDYMLADSGAKILLTNLSEERHFNCQLPIVNCQLLMSSLEAPLHHSSLIEIPHNSGSLAYVIYTSGSTGKPKGVLIRHSSLTDYIFTFIRMFKISADDIVLQQFSISFDASIEELYPALLTGGRIVVVPKDTIIDIDSLTRTIEEQRITLISITPLLLNEINKIDRERMQSLRLVLSGGDALRFEHIDHIVNHIEVYNTYGPTEATVCAAYYQCSPRDRGNVPIGKPITNHSLYILGKNNDLLPVWVPGELCISGSGLARGYLNQPELTAKKFFSSSFLRFSASQLLSFSLYRTGDLARWLPNGNIEFLGRMDHQVKLRGFRIELGEIESQLLTKEEIKQTAVLAKERETGDKYLCAYIVSSRPLAASELREYLLLKLPDYMIPAYFVSLEKMPLTSGGKVDRRALPDPEYASTVEEYVPPGDKIEEILADIWQQVLGIEKIGITDHFFKNGGDSIKAIQVSARLKAFGMSLKVNDLFSYPTISQLGKYVKYPQRNVYQGITTGETALTPIQQWFFEKDFTGKHHFNQAVMLYKEEGFNETFIKKIFAKLLQHHDALRMVYDFSREGRVVQRNRGVEGKLFDFEMFHFENKDNTIEQANRLQAGINIEKGPLVKVGLFKTPEGDHLLIVIHHLVVDGVSWRILLEDFSTGYQQLLQGETIRFQEKSDSFKDWSYKLKEYSQSKAMLEELEYWKKVEKSRVEPLPVDHKIEKREKKLRDTQTLRLQLKREETGKLMTDVHRAYNTNMNDILLTALAMALREWAGIEITAINLESHGREPVIENMDISRTVGWFTAQFPVLLDIKDTADLSYSIKSIKETLRHIPNNGIGYGILRYLTPPHKKEGVSFTLEPQVNFNYLGQFDVPNSGGIFTLSHLETGNAASPEMESIYNININGMVVEGAFTFSFTYNRHEYETASIGKLLDRFHCSLLEIIEYCTARVEVELTPSDLGDQELSLEELDHIKEMINL